MPGDLERGKARNGTEEEVKDNPKKPSELKKGHATFHGNLVQNSPLGAIPLVVLLNFKASFTQQADKTSHLQEERIRLAETCLQQQPVPEGNAAGSASPGGESCMAQRGETPSPEDVFTREIRARRTCKNLLHDEMQLNKGVRYIEKQWKNTSGKN